MSAVQLYPSVQHCVYANTAEELQLVELQGKNTQLALVEPGFAREPFRWVVLVISGPGVFTKLVGMPTT